MNGHRVEFAYLGALEVSAGGRLVNVGGATPRALLAMLLLRFNQPVRPDALMQALWGDHPPASATASLHSHISRLRRLLTGADETVRIERRPGGYALIGDPERLDARRFERLVADGAQRAGQGSPQAAAVMLRQALGLWRGPALVDLAHAEFARSEAVRLDELRLETTARVIDLELAVGAAANLVPELEHLVVEHPTQERFRGQLMLALYRNGRQGDALAAYRRARAELAEDLGVEPGPALRRLEELILRQSPELDLPVAQAPLTPPPAGARRGAGVFVGRTGELAALDEALGCAAKGAGQLVVIEAGAGLGKTALVEEFTSRVSDAGIRVYLGRAWEETGGPPFWPWTEVLRAHAGETGTGATATATELTDLLPGWDTEGLPRDPVQASIRLYRSVTHRLLVTDGAGPTVIVLEDFHGADESSLGLLRFLLRHLRAARALLVLTHRPVAENAVLSGLLAEAAREVEVRHLVVPPLGEVEVRGYLEATLGADLSPTVAAAVIRQAEGHAFFLTEIVRLLRPRLRSGRPQPGPDPTADIPRTVREMISRRFVGLADDCLRVLLAASVIGREFDLRLLAHVAAVDLDAVLDRAEEAAGAGLLRELARDRVEYRFDHALTQQALYSRLPTPRRVVLHARAAAAIEAGIIGPPQAHLTELARHRCASVAEGGTAAAVDAALAAAEAAMSQYAFEDAVHLHRLALDTHEHNCGDPAGTTGLLLALGDAEWRGGQAEASRVSFLRAAELARASGRAEQLAAAALGFGAAFEARGHDPTLVALLEEALDGPAGTAPALRARLLARLSMALNLADASGRRGELSATALATARQVADPALEAFCLSARFFALWGPDHSAQRLECADEALQLSQRLGDAGLELDGLTWTICEFLERADRPALEAHLERHARLAEATSHPLHGYYARMWRATIAALDGRAAQAVDLAARAAAHGRELTELAVPRRTAVLLVALRDLGRVSELVTAVDEAVLGYPYFPTWRAARAMAHLEIGDPRPAEELLRQLPEDPGAFFPRDANWVNGMALLATVVVGLGEVTRAEQLRTLLEPHRGRFSVLRFGVTSIGSIDATLGCLADTCRDWEGAERHFRSAITITRTFGAHPFRAYAECDYARMLLRRGEPHDGEHARRLIASACATAEELDLPGLNSYCTKAASPTLARP